MIGFIEGSVKKRLTDRLIIATQNGVGYEIRTSLTTLSGLGCQDQEIALWIHTRVREDAIELFGFESWSERLCFETVTQISGVGPKLGLSILSHMSVSQLRAMVMAEDTEGLCSVPGIGKRIAEKIMLELKRKVDNLSTSDQISDTKDRSSSVGRLAFDKTPTETPQDDSWQIEVRQALLQLGYKEKDLKKVLSHLNQSELDKANLATLIRAALEYMRQGATTSNRSSEGSSLNSMKMIF